MSQVQSHRDSVLSEQRRASPLPIPDGEAGRRTTFPSDSFYTHPDCSSSSVGPSVAVVSRQWRSLHREPESLKVSESESPYKHALVLGGALRPLP